MKVSEMDQKQVRRVVDILMANGVENGTYLTMGATPDSPALRMGWRHGDWTVAEPGSIHALVVTPDLGTALDWLLGVLPEESDDD